MFWADAEGEADAAAGVLAGAAAGAVTGAATGAVAAFLEEGIEVIDGPGEPFVPLDQSPASQADAASKTYLGKEVDRKARLGMKPEPSYTESARVNQIAGTVVLRVFFSSNGMVTNIRVLSGLPNGLTEKAIDVARKIKFLPAIKDGKYVSMWMQLEYNFNLY